MILDHRNINSSFKLVSQLAVPLLPIIAYQSLRKKEGTLKLYITNSSIAKAKAYVSVYIDVLGVLPGVFTPINAIVSNIKVDKNKTVIIDIPNVPSGAFVGISSTLVGVVNCTVFAIENDI